MTELDIAPKTPELSETSEIVLGDYETVKLPTHSYVKMSQVRGERNRVTEELKDSILNSGLSLISQLHCARMTLDDLELYIDFVNHVWGSHSSVGDIIDQQQPDGYFYLIVDGHSRHQAIEELEDDGAMPPVRITANVHPITSPEEIIRLQLHANIHSQPPRERQAIALVESYEWGLRTGRWRSRKEYIKQHGNVGVSVLDEALAFSNLPPEVRNHVSAGHMPYAAGVGLARSMPDVRRFIASKTGLEVGSTKDQEATLDEAVNLRLVVEAQRIVNSKLNSTASEKRITSWREQLRRSTDAPSDEQQEETLFKFGLKSSNDLLIEDQMASRREIAEFMRIYGRRPGSAAADLLHLVAPLVDPGVVEEIYADFKQNLERAERRIGSRSIISSETLFDEPTETQATFEIS